MRRSFLCTLLVFASLFATGTLSGQEGESAGRSLLEEATAAARGESGSPSPSEEGNDDSAVDPEKVRQRRDEMQSTLASLRRDDAPEPLLAAVQDTLDALEAQLGELGRQDAMAAERRRLEAEKRKDPAVLVDAEPPFSFSELDPLLDRRGAAERSRQLQASAVDDSLAEVDEAQNDLEDLRQERGQLEESIRDEEGRAREAETRPRIEVLDWRVRAAEENLELERLRLEGHRTEEALRTDEIRFLDGVIDWVRERFSARPSDLEARLERLETARQELEPQLQDLEREATLAERRWQKVQKELEASDNPDEAVLAEAEARRLELDRIESERRLLEAQRRRLEERKKLWRHRFDLALPGQTATEHRASRERVELIDAELEREKRSHEHRLDDLRGRRRLIDDRLGGEAISAAESAQLDRQRESLDRLVDLYEASLDRITETRTLAERTLDESENRQVRPLEMLTAAWESLRRVWSFDILTVEDRPITLGKVFFAILLILGGYLLSKRVTSGLGRMLQERVGLSSGSSHALQSFAFYLLLVIFFFWAFQLVGIPLTVFTLLGGVLAIGVGFGSQNVVNNFISGLILLAERPIKVGDLVEVDGVVGSVQRIGLRSTRVRAGDNTHVIVPNSSFLEKNVLNWTISDDVIRVEVDVGVAYGSPTDRVAALLEEVVRESPVALQGRGFDVLFTDFGSDALMFRVTFWIRVHAYLDTLRAQSDVRFRIDEKFRAAGLTIAFPQRDVHLDTLSPLQVRLVRDDEESPS